MAQENVDPAVSFEEQLQSDHEGPVVLVSTYQVPADRMDILLEAWTERARKMRTKPGNLGGQMHRAIGGASVLVNYVVWESLAAYRAAMNSMEEEPFVVEGLTMRPVLVEKIAIPGLCVA